MIFNGLSGSDLIIFNALAELLGDAAQGEASVSELSIIGNRCEKTTRNALGRLVEYGFIARNRPGPGPTPYTYRLTEDGK